MDNDKITMVMQIVGAGLGAVSPVLPGPWGAVGKMAAGLIGGLSSALDRGEDPHEILDRLLDEPPPDGGRTADEQDARIEALIRDRFGAQDGER